MNIGKTQGWLEYVVSFKGRTVLQWIWIMCRMEWEKVGVPDDWEIVVIIPLYQREGERKRVVDRRI